MSESAKTLTFVGVAVVALLLAWASRPSPLGSPTDDTGELFFPEFTDELAAASLEIVAYDEASAAPKAFRVGRSGSGVWTIPSKLDYPADAEEHLAEAAASVMDLEKLGVVSDRPADHELYGVVDPTSAEPGTEGIGMRVTLEDSSSAALADLIIGKEDTDQPGIRYVRLPKQDRVYRTNVDTSKLTTRFQDWIELDLLELNTWDISRVRIDSYSIEETPTSLRLVRGDELELTYNDEDSSWSLPELGEEEELDTQKLNDLKRALDELKIVDVQRKPEGLSQELRAEEGLLDEAARRSLAARGFYLVEQGLFSNQGEVVVSLKDGVEYVLRFGDVAVGTENEEGEDDASGTNRYLFIMANFNESLIPPPELEPEPQGETAGPDTAETEGEGADDAADDASDETNDAADAESDNSDADEDEDTDDDGEPEEEVDPELERIRDENQRKQT